MLKIWGRPNSINVQKVMWTVGELGLEHERIDVGREFGGLDTEDYCRMNPNRKIPVIEDGEAIIWESHACVRYLAARYDSDGLFAADPAERSLADRWMEWKNTTVLPHLHICFWGLIRTPEADRDMPAINRAADDLAEVWKLLDDHLESRLFVVDDKLTMGDIPLGTAFYRYVNLPIDRPSFPNIENWYERLKARPAFKVHVMVPVT